MKGRYFQQTSGSLSSLESLFLIIKYSSVHYSDYIIAFGFRCLNLEAMGETGKRPRSGREKEGFQGQNQFKKPFRENSDGELIVYRLLCPENVVGSLIGKSGKVINSLRQETKARIKIVDPFPGSIERIVTIYCFVNEKKNADFEGDNTIPLCAAQDALLRVHKTIFNAISNIGDSEERQRDEARLLVPASQAANIIGKSGATIKKIRAKTRANIKVFQKDPEDPTHSCAMSFDNFVSVTLYSYPSLNPSCVRKNSP